MSLQWTTLLNSYPSQSWTFVLAGDNPYSLFLSWRIGLRRLAGLPDPQRTQPAGSVRRRGDATWSRMCSQRRASSCVRSN